MFQGALRGFVRGKFSKRQSKTVGGSLSPKHMPKGWYKGRNVPSIGRHTAKGGYIVMPEKIPIYVVPDLTNFKLRPYVSPTCKPPPPQVLNKEAELAALKSTQIIPETPTETPTNTQITDTQTIPPTTTKIPPSKKKGE